MSDGGSLSNPGIALRDLIRGQAEKVANTVDQVALATLTDPGDGTNVGILLDGFGAGEVTATWATVAVPEEGQRLAVMILKGGQNFYVVGVLNTSIVPVFDHGGLGGLGDDDHPQYLLKTGGTVAGDLTVTGDLTVDGVMDAQWLSGHSSINLFGAERITNSLLDNILYGAESRFTVTNTGDAVTGALGLLFNGNYESWVAVGLGNTSVINIDLTPLTGATGIVYSAGKIHVTAYYTQWTVGYEPTLRIKDQYGTWYAQGTPDRNLSTFAGMAIWEWDIVTPNNWATDLEFTFTSDGITETWPNSIEYYTSRVTGLLGSAVTKYGSNDFIYPQLFFTQGGGGYGPSVRGYAGGTALIDWWSKGTSRTAYMGHAWTGSDDFHLSVSGSANAIYVLTNGGTQLLLHPSNQSYLAGSSQQALDLFGGPGQYNGARIELWSGDNATYGDQMFLDAVKFNFRDENGTQIATMDITDGLQMANHVLGGPLDPTAGTHVGDRDYNDARYLLLSGGTMAGGIVMNGNTIFGANAGTLDLYGDDTAAGGRVLLFSDSHATYPSQVMIDASTLSVRTTAGTSKLTFDTSTGYLSIGQRLYMDNIGGNDYIILDDALGYFGVVQDGVERFRSGVGGDIHISGDQIFFSGISNDNYLQNSDDSYFRFVINGTERWRVDVNGNVQQSGGYITYSGGNYIQQSGTTWWRVVINSGERFRVTNASHIVVGGAADNYAVNVQGYIQTQHPTTTNSANVHTALVSGSDYLMYRSTSSERYKSEIADAEYLADIRFRPRKFWSLLDDDYFYGFITEEVVALIPEAAQDFDDDGHPDNYDTRSVVAATTAKANRNEDRIAVIEAVLGIAV